MKKDGVVVKFDQDEIIEDVVEELYSDLSEEDKATKREDRQWHQLLKWGVAYYPKVCTDPKREKKCLF